MSARPWTDDEALPERTTLLLEASAGTGKTFQLANLVLRLVAEERLELDRILAITFTNAATASLREGVRKRLRDGLAALRGAGKPDEPTFARLWDLRDREARAGAADALTVEQRLERALGAFDLAPISTIHGFSQRMLQELAFDSHQDSELELLANDREVRELLCDDALASCYARATPRELTVLREAGFTREALLETARAMTAATTPEVEPAGATEQDPVQAARRALEHIDRLGAPWNDAETERVCKAMVAEAVNATRRLRRWNATALEAWLAMARSWLAEGAWPLKATDRKDAWWMNLTCEACRDAWTDASPVERTLWWPLIEALDDVRRASESVWGEFAPLAGFARSVRARFEAEIRRRRALTFNGMVSRLAERIVAEGDSEQGLAARLRERFHAVFVDEFQDTDEAQWTVLSRAFHGHRRLFLIGDPKQAIYSFRGADVHVYLKAACLVDAANRRTMTRNYRSDARAVDAMNELWREGSGAFGEEHGEGRATIDYVQVDAKHENRLQPTQSGLEAPSGLELRWVDARVAGGLAGAGIGRADERLVARLAAREAASLLGDAPPLHLPCAAEDSASARSSGGDAASPRETSGAPRTRAPKPRELAVLVDTNQQARSMRRSLQRQGIPAVAASQGSVFAAPVAKWLVAWLRAVAGEERGRAARTAAVTPLFGWTANELAWALCVAKEGAAARVAARAAGVKDEIDWDAWTARLARAAEGWARLGFARTLDRELTDCQVFERLLAAESGERHATDLRHLFELLHLQDRTHQPGPAALADWLQAAIRDAEGHARDDAGEQAQRLESDADAVTIETIHKSKGLEYPLVLLPFAWHAHRSTDNGKPLLFRRTDESAEGVPVLHAGSTIDKGRKEALEAQEREARREALRKLYVGLTRAKHRTIAWYGPLGENGLKTSATALGRLLMRSPSVPGFDDAEMPVFQKDNAKPNGNAGRGASDGRATQESRETKGNTSARSPSPVDGGACEDAVSGSAVTDEAPANPAWMKAQARLEGLVERAAGAITCWAERPLDADDARARPGLSMNEATSQKFQSAPWPQGRPRLEGRWVVTSYSALADHGSAPDKDEKQPSAAERAALAALEETTSLGGAGAPAVGDTDALSPDRAEPAASLASTALVKPPLCALPERGRLSGGWGTPYGTWVHAVLEHLDFATGDAKDGRPRGELVRELAVGGKPVHAEELTRLLPAILATPLDSTRDEGAVLGLPRGFSLAALEAKDRLDELAFDLAVGDGTAWCRSASTRGRDAASDVKRTTLERVAGCADPRAVYDALLSALDEPGIELGPALQAWLHHHAARRDAGLALVGSIAGILTGSIDLVFRAGPEGARRMFIVDYKTNRIGRSEPGHYSGPWLDWTMANAGYALQSLLYTLALHRHLRLRLAGYDYDRDVGGALYLFLRGMSGPDTPRCPETGRCLGVYGNRWPKRVVEALDRALTPLRDEGGAR